MPPEKLASERNLNTHLNQACRLWVIGYFILMLSLAAQADENLTIVHGATPQAKMMEFHENGTASGFKSLLIEELARRLNWKVHHQQCPFQRCLFSMRKGQYDLMVFVSAIPERTDYLNFIQVWPNTRVIPFFVREEDQQQLKSYEDLADMRIGVVNGYAYFPRFDKDAQLNKIQVSSEQQLARMLLAGRIDTYIAFEDRPQLSRQQLSKQQPSNQQQLTQPSRNIIKADYSEKVSSSALIAVSKFSPLSNELAAIEKEIITMVTDGSLLQFWQRSNPKQSFPYPLITYPHYTPAQPAAP